MKKYIIYILLFLLVSCQEDFLEKNPLDAPSSETFWTSADNAEMWVNTLYNSLPSGGQGIYWDNWSDDGHGRTKPTEHGGEIANGTFQTTSGIVANEWSYTTIRRCLEFFEKIEEIPNISQERKNELTGQVNFFLAYNYFHMMTLFRDIPLVTMPIAISESDVPKSPKTEILTYVLEKINNAIEELPLTWPTNEAGRVTKGAALALKTRALLYNQKWTEAASSAKQLMDLNIYELHPEFREIFIEAFNNKTKEVILAYQHVETVREWDVYRTYGFIEDKGWAISLATPAIVNAFECIDGLPIDESPLYDPNEPFENRDPRFYKTIIYPYETFAGYYYDPMQGRNPAFSLTYMHWKKYNSDRQPGETHGHTDWIVFRYAEVLLNYAEAKNEASGPDNSIYEALDLIRERAGMPLVDRGKYNNKEKLREFIRNERRVELACEGLRYFDIIRWRIAENVLNVELKSFEVPGKLPAKVIETRIFDPNKHYVWPIPQYAIDRAKNLEQHPEWK